jgi:hypothetical protein
VNEEITPITDWDKVIKKFEKFKNPFLFSLFKGSEAYCFDDQETMLITFDDLSENRLADIILSRRKWEPKIVSLYTGIKLITIGDKRSVRPQTEQEVMDRFYKTIVKPIAEALENDTLEWKIEKVNNPEKGTK